MAGSVPHGSRTNLAMSPARRSSAKLYTPSTAFGEFGEVRAAWLGELLAKHVLELVRGRLVVARRHLRDAAIERGPRALVCEDVLVLGADHGKRGGGFVLGK